MCHIYSYLPLAQTLVILGLLACSCSNVAHHFQHQERIPHPKKKTRTMNNEDHLTIYAHPITNISPIRKTASSLLSDMHTLSILASPATALSHYSLDKTT